MTTNNVTVTMTVVVLTSITLAVSTRGWTLSVLVGKLVVVTEVDGVEVFGNSLVGVQAVLT